MPIHIDHIDTAIEITSASGTTRPDAASSPRPPDASPGRAALRETVMQIFADELDRYARMRGH